MHHTLQALDRAVARDEAKRLIAPDVADGGDLDQADVLEWLGKRKDPDGWIIDALADATDPRNTTKLANLLPEILGTRMGKLIFAYLEKACEEGR